MSNRFNKQIKCLHCSKYKAGRVFFISANKPFFISLPNCMLVNRKWMTVGLKSMRRLTQQGRVRYPFRNSNGMYYSCMYYGNMGYKVSKEGYKLDRVLNNNQHSTQMKSLCFVNRCSAEFSKCAKIRFSKSFSLSKIS